MKIQRVLIVEDEPDHAELIRRYLGSMAEEPGDLELRHTLGEALSALDEQTYCAVLLDLHLPDAVGLEALDPVLMVAGEAPVLSLTGLEDQRTALDALARGAQDCIFKREMDPERLARALRFALRRKAFERECARVEAQNSIDGGQTLQAAAELARGLKRPLDDLLASLDSGWPTNGSASNSLRARAHEAHGRLRMGLELLQDVLCARTRIESNPGVVALADLCREISRRPGARRPLLPSGTLPELASDATALTRLLEGISSALPGAPRPVELRHTQDPIHGPVLTFSCIGTAPSPKEAELIVTLATPQAELLGGSLWSDGTRLLLSLPGLPEAPPPQTGF